MMRIMFFLPIVILAIVLVADFMSVPDGEVIFRREGCVGCHSVRGLGGMAGPELTVAARRRSYLWLRRQIRYPRSHNPQSRMPSYQHLKEAELCALIRYLRQ